MKTVSAIAEILKKVIVTWLGDVQAGGNRMA